MSGVMQLRRSPLRRSARQPKARGPSDVPTSPKNKRVGKKSGRRAATLAAAPAPRPAAAREATPTLRDAGAPADAGAAVARWLQEKAAKDLEDARQLVVAAAKAAAETISSSDRLAKKIFANEWETFVSGYESAPLHGTARERSLFVQEAAHGQPLGFCRAVEALAEAAFVHGASKKAKPRLKGIRADAAAAVAAADAAAKGAQTSSEAVRMLDGFGDAPEYPSEEAAAGDGLEPESGIDPDEEAAGDGLDPMGVVVSDAEAASDDDSQRAWAIREEDDRGEQTPHEADAAAAPEDAGATPQRKRKSSAEKQAKKQNKSKKRRAAGSQPNATTGEENADAAERREQRRALIEELALHAQPAVDRMPMTADNRPATYGGQLGAQLYPQSGAPDELPGELLQVARAQVAQEPRTAATHAAFDPRSAHVLADVTHAEATTFRRGYLTHFSTFTRQCTQLLANSFRDGNGSPVAGHTDRVMRRFDKLASLYESARRAVLLNEDLRKGFAAWEMAAVLFAAQPQKNSAGSSGSSNIIDILAAHVAQHGQEPGVLDIPKCVQDAKTLATWIDTAIDLCGDGEGSEARQTLYLFSQTVIRTWRSRTGGAEMAAACRAVVDIARHGPDDPLSTRAPAPAVTSAKPAATSAKPAAADTAVSASDFAEVVKALKRLESKLPSQGKAAAKGKPAKARDDAKGIKKFGDRSFSNPKICHLWAKHTFGGAAKECDRPGCNYEHFGVEDGVKVTA